MSRDRRVILKKKIRFLISTYTKYTERRSNRDYTNYDVSYTFESLCISTNSTDTFSGPKHLFDKWNIKVPLFYQGPSWLGEVDTV